MYIYYPFDGTAKRCLSMRPNRRAAAALKQQLEKIAFNSTTIPFPNRGGEMGENIDELCSFWRNAGQLEKLKNKAAVCVCVCFVLFPQWMMVPVSWYLNFGTFNNFF